MQQQMKQDYVLYHACLHICYCRNKDRVKRAVEAIRKAASSSSSSSSSSSVQGYTADLSCLAGVRQLAAAVQADHPRLYALVNNAGVYETQKK
jgi:NAD(P)-dependent dehydrogenase (short-subunit alcohol dehydrogenase family)